MIYKFESLLQHYLVISFPISNFLELSAVLADKKKSVNLMGEPKLNPPHLPVYAHNVTLAIATFIVHYGSRGCTIKFP